MSEGCQTSLPEPKNIEGVLVQSAIILFSPTEFVSGLPDNSVFIAKNRAEKNIKKQQMTDLENFSRISLLISFCKKGGGQLLLNVGDSLQVQNSHMLNR